MNFEFATAAQIIFGAGSVSRLGASIKSFGRHALVVTGGNPARFAEILGNLRQSGISFTTFQVSKEPEISGICQGIAAAKSAQCDLVIALGGGSVIDAAKAIAAMLANDGELLDYLEIIGRGKSLANPSVPFIAIPTTAGTGSEVTRNAVIAAPEQKVKVSLRSPGMLARLAIIDPELTYILPPALTARTGLDALTQLIEPYTCARANPMTDGLCLEGIRRAARALPAAVADGNDKSAREAMATASLFGGLALANAGLGAVHGFAGPIGGSFPAPHGAVCGILLPHVMAVNIRALRQRDSSSPILARYNHVATLLTGEPHATADAGVEWVTKLVADLPVPRLREYGIRAEHTADLVTKAANSSSMKANPVKLTPEELTEILHLAL